MTPGCYLASLTWLRLGGCVGEVARLNLGAGTDLVEPPNATPPRYASLRDYLRVLREQRWVILATVVVAGAIALVVSLQQDRTYEASASLAFQDASQDLSLLGGSTSQKTPIEQTPQARAEIIKSPKVIAGVRESLKSDVPIGELQSAISTSLDEDTFLVDVTATWDDSVFAARLANTFAAEAASYTNTQAKRRFTDALKSVKRQLDALGTDITKQGQRAALTSQLTRLKFLLANSKPAQVVRRARPGAQVSPRPVRNTALGLLLGLAIGIAIAFLRDTLDRRLHGSREIQNELLLPMLGFVREEMLGGIAWHATKDVEMAQEDLESFRILRQNLDFLSVDSPLRSVLVTSALPEEGKSTVADSLASASALLGRRTLLVECDLRRPTLAARLGVKPTPGLTDYLAGLATPEEVLQLVEIDGGRGSSNGSKATTWRSNSLPLACITAGTPSPHPAELLQSEQFRSFLKTVSEAYETVIVDTSPLLPVADTLELIPVVDGVLLCVRSRQTTREQAFAAKAALEHFPARPTALVVTGLRRQDSDEYGYYSYGYSYGSAATSAAALGGAGPRATTTAAE